MQTANQERGADPLPARTLDFRQAMKDFRTMFPTLESDLIECVLRSNNGHVDSTIDQLLQLSQDSTRNNISRRPNMLHRGNRFNAYDDSTDSEDSIPSELLDPPTSSDDDDVPVREPPPMYTPRAGDPAPNFFGTPIEAPICIKEKGGYNDVGSYGSQQIKAPEKTYRAWNPPMLGALPEDFLRILPQQFMDMSIEKGSSQKKRTLTNGQQNRQKDASDHSHHRQERLLQPHQNKSSTKNNSSLPINNLHLISGTEGASDSNAGPVPPPRPSRTIDSQRSRKISNTDRDEFTVNRTESIEHGNLFIKPAAGPRSAQSDALSNGHRTRHHHRSSSSRSCATHHHHPHQSVAAASKIGSRARRNSDFTHHRMVMVSRSSDPNMPVSSNSNLNGFHSPLPAERSSSNHRYHRSSNSFHHTSDHRSATSSRVRTSSSPTTGLSAPFPRSRQSTSASGSRTRQRNQFEEEQYVEDCRLAILLQNEEFIHELKRNEEFLKALEKDRHKEAASVNKSDSTQNDKLASKDNVVPLPDPDAKYPHGSRNPSSVKRAGIEDSEKDDESAFKENLKHMGKSARKKFNEIAKKFSVRRKSSYKSMRTIDPVFANCDDNFDELPGSRSPVFDL